jgi:hypothetical protein
MMFLQRYDRLFNRLFVIILREILLLLSICNIRRHFAQKLAEKNKKSFSAGGIISKKQMLKGRAPCEKQQQHDYQEPPDTDYVAPFNQDHFT